MIDEKSNGVNLGFKNKLWEMDDKIRGHVDAAEYKYVALGLVLSLARMRDTLLPALISGELFISDTEKLFDGLNINGVLNG